MERLFETLKIQPKNLSLYRMAFSHSSYVNEVHQKKDYERLEFLGDAVVDLAVSDYLFRHKNVEEGDMTKIRASYVCENACFTYASDLNFSEYIKVGHGEELEGGLLFLVNNEAAGFITGVVLPIDGGFSAYSGVW